MNVQNVQPRFSNTSGTAITMTSTMARSRARRLINSLTPYDDLMKFWKSPQDFALTRAVREVVKKKNNRSLLRVAKKTIEPLFGNTSKIIRLSKNRKIFSINGTFRVEDVSVLDDETLEHLFQETTAAQVVYRVDHDDKRCDVNVFVPATVTQHAAQRLLERRCCALDELDEEINKILNRLARLTAFIDTLSIGHKTTGYLLPWNNGALGCVYMPIYLNGYKVWHLSCRTFLEDGILNDEYDERLAFLKDAPWEELKNQSGELKWDVQAWKQHLVRNAIPWRILADRRLETPA